MALIRIRRHLDDTILYDTEAEDLREAVVKAVLFHANLFRADLSGADLSGADLSGANLFRADMSRANLFGTKHIQAERCTPLLILLDQPGPIRAYKLVTKDGVGPFNGGITYKVGDSYAVTQANTDVTQVCGAGINVATLDWCLRELCDGYRVLIVEFEAKDIAAIPTATDGKFRLHRCKVVAEKQIDHLVAAPKVEAVA